MKRITQEQAKEYLTLEEDLMVTGVEDAVYYTLTPSRPGWEKVTYYTARKSDPYKDYSGDFDSWVYILSSSLQPGILKIGYTRMEPQERAKQISKATGVAIPYKVEWAYPCYNGFMLEQEVNNELARYRVSKNKEFFQVELDQAKTVIERLGLRYR